MDKFTLYLGLNDKDTKQQKMDIVHAYNLCSNILIQYTNGATISNAQGIYKHNDGTMVFENTLRIELLFITNETVNKIAKELKRKFNQEAIAMEHSTVNSTSI